MLRKIQASKGENLILKAQATLACSRNSCLPNNNPARDWNKHKHTTNAGARSLVLGGSPASIREAFLDSSVATGFGCFNDAAVDCDGVPTIAVARDSCPRACASDEAVST